MHAWLRVNGKWLLTWVGIVGGFVSMLATCGFQVAKVVDHLPISTAAADTRYVKQGDEVVGLIEGRIPADVVKRSRLATQEDVAAAVVGIDWKLTELRSLFVQSRADQAAQLQLLIQTLQGIPMRSPIDPMLDHRSRPRP